MKIIVKEEGKFCVYDANNIIDMFKLLSGYNRDKHYDKTEIKDWLANTADRWSNFIKCFRDQYIVFLDLEGKPRYDIVTLKSVGYRRIKFEDAYEDFFSERPPLDIKNKLLTFTNFNFGSWDYPGNESD